MFKCPNNNINSSNLSSCFKSFIIEKKANGLSKTTIETYTQHIKETINIIGDIDIQDFTKQEYNKVVLALQSRNIKSVTVATYCRSIRAFLYWCMDEGYLNRFKIKIPKYQKTIKQVYTDEELKRLLKKPNLKTCTFTEYKIWFAENILIATGLRVRSLLNIKIKDIDLNDNSVIVNTTKNKTPLKTYYNKLLASIIKEYLGYRGGQDEDYLICTNEGEQMKVRSLQSAIQKYNNTRGVNKTSIHLFRHTFAKNAILAGVDVFTLMRMLQHANIETTQNYVKMLNVDIKKSCELYNPQKLYCTNKKHNKITMRKH